MQAGAPAWFSNDRGDFEDTSGTDISHGKLKPDAPAFEPGISYPAVASNLRSNAPVWEPTRVAGDSAQIGGEVWNPISQDADEWQAIQDMIDRNSYVSGDIPWNAADTYIEAEVASTWPLSFADPTLENGGYTDGGLWVPPASKPSNDLESVTEAFHKKANALVAKERMLTALKKVAPNEEPNCDNYIEHDNGSTQVRSHRSNYHSKFFNKLPDDVCWDFVKFGSCKRDTWCTWKHIRPDEAQPENAADRQVHDATRADRELPFAGERPLHDSQKVSEQAPARKRLPIGEHKRLQRALASNDTAALASGNVAAVSSPIVRPPPGFSPRSEVSTPIRDRAMLDSGSSPNAHSTEKFINSKGMPDLSYQRPAGFSVTPAKPTNIPDTSALVDEQRYLAGSKQRWADVVKK